MGQQVKAEQGREIREAPGPYGLHLEKFQQPHRDQRNPDLNLHGVLTDAHKCLGSLRCCFKALKSVRSASALICFPCGRKGRVLGSS